MRSGLGLKLASPPPSPLSPPHCRPLPVLGDSAPERTYLLKCVRYYRSLGDASGALLFIKTNSGCSLATCFLSCCPLK